ncbi:MAG: HAMP domain-containing protein, partial [Bacteroidota bacterium]
MLRFFLNWKIKAKLWCLIGLFSLGFIGFGWFSYDTIGRLKVNGPIYRNIVQGKDLIADVLPPPEYVIEAYLLTLQLLGENAPSKREGLVQTLGRLEADYEARHAFWKKELPEGRLRDAMLRESYEPAKAFFSLLRHRFIPFVRQGKLVEARALAFGELRQHYERHRAAIDEVVSLSIARNARDEQSAARMIHARTVAFLSLGLGIIALFVLLSLALVRALVLPLKALVALLREIAQGEGDLTRRLPAVTRDEVGELSRWFNRFMEQLQGLIGRVKETAAELDGAA